MGDEIHFENRDQSVVGQQIGVVHGNVGGVSQSAPTGGAELANLTMELRLIVDQAEEQQATSPAMIQAARAALEEADAAASAGGKSGKERFLNALGVIKAAIGDVAGIAASLAAIASSVRT